MTSVLLLSTPLGMPEYKKKGRKKLHDKWQNDVYIDYRRERKSYLIYLIVVNLIKADFAKREEWESMK